MKNRRGESITEAIAGFLIITMSALILYTAAAAGAGISRGYLTRAREMNSEISSAGSFIAGAGTPASAQTGRLIFESGEGAADEMPVRVYISEKYGFTAFSAPEV